MGVYGRFVKSSFADFADVRFYRALVGEVLGTAYLTFLGCTSVTTTGGDVVAISLVFGLAVASMVWVLASVSGGHINPAVTFGMLAARKISLIRALLYVVAQCVGATLGAGLTESVACRWQLASLSAKSSADDAFSCELGITTLGKGMTAGGGVSVEFLITFVLVIVVFATCDSSRKDLQGSGPLAIGLSVSLCHLVAIPLTGASMNPARTFGPAALKGMWDNQWIYWIGPGLGGVAAALLYDLILAGDASIKKFGFWLTGSEKKTYTVNADKEKDTLEPLAKTKDDEDRV